MMLRHMDPHSPYLPPVPFDRMFYHGDEPDPRNKSMRAGDGTSSRSATTSRRGCRRAAPTRTTSIAQYDGAVAYMDACIARIFTQLESLGILDDTIVVINGDHGETLYDHECWFDHHGMYDVTLHVPLIIRYPTKVPAGQARRRLQPAQGPRPDAAGAGRDQDHAHTFDGRSLMQLVRGEVAELRERVLHHRVHVDAQARLAHAAVEAHRRAGARLPLQAEGRAVQPGRRPARGPQRRRASIPDVVEDAHARGWTRGSRKREKEDRHQEPDAPPGRLARAQGLRRVQVEPSRRTTRCTSATSTQAEKLQAKDKAKPAASAAEELRHKYATKGQHDPGDEIEQSLVTDHRPRPRRHARDVAHAQPVRRLHGRHAQQVRRPPPRRGPCTKPAASWPSTSSTRAACSGISRKLHTMPIDPRFTKLVESYLVIGAHQPRAAQGLEAPGDDADLPVDRADVPRRALHQLGPRPARQHPRQAPHRRPRRLRRAVRQDRRRAPPPRDQLELPGRDRPRRRPSPSAGRRCGSRTSSSKQDDDAQDARSSSSASRW